MVGDISRSQAGFSFTEVLVAAMIFAVASAGAILAMTAVRRPAADSAEAISAAYVGKRVLDGLRSKVSATDWDSGALSLGTHDLPNVATVGGVTYNAVYVVEDDTALGGTGGRRVTLNVIW